VNSPSQERSYSAFDQRGPPQCAHHRHDVRIVPSRFSTGGHAFGWMRDSTVGRRIPVGIACAQPLRCSLNLADRSLNDVVPFWLAPPTLQDFQRKARYITPP